MKSNFKRAVASISTIALAASTFAGFSITASAAGATVPFVGQDAGGAVRITDNGNGTFTSGSNAGNRYALAIADLSEVDGIYTADEVTIEFDSTINQGSRWVVGIGDKSVRGTTAGTSNKNTYDTNGLSAFFGTHNGSTYVLNGSTSIGGALGTSIHAKYVLNNADDTYTLTLSAGGAERVANGAAEKADIVEIYSWNNNDTITISGVTVTTSGVAPAEPTAEPIVPSGVNATAPYEYNVGNIDYGVGAVQATSSFWTADASYNADKDEYEYKDNVTISTARAGVHYTGIDNQNYLGYPTDTIIIPISSGFTTNGGVLYIMQNAPAEDSMVHVASGAYSDATANGGAQWVNKADQAEIKKWNLDKKTFYVKSFANVEDQIFAHPDALWNTDDPAASATALTDPNMIARITFKSGGTLYDVAAGGAGIAVSELNKRIDTGVDTAGNAYPRALFIRLQNPAETDQDLKDSDNDYLNSRDNPRYVSQYQADDLFVYSANTTGTFGPLKVDFRVPTEDIDIAQEFNDFNTADYYSDHKEGVYYLGRVNTNGLNQIDVTGDADNTAETVVKLFALSNKIAGKDELKDFLHDYTHNPTTEIVSPQEPDPTTGATPVPGSPEAGYTVYTYNNVKYTQIGEVTIPAGSDEPETTDVENTDDTVKFIYAVVMKKVPVDAQANQDITDTGKTTPGITNVTYHYAANRYRNAILAEYLLLNMDIANVIYANDNKDNEDDFSIYNNKYYKLIDGTTKDTDPKNPFAYADYMTQVNNVVDMLQELDDSGKTENVFTDRNSPTYAAKWAKIRDEKEAIETIVKPIYDEIRPILNYIDNNDDGIDTLAQFYTDYVRHGLPIPEGLPADPAGVVNQLWMNYTRASVLGKAYVKENNFDQLKEAHDALMKFYDDIIAEYTDNVDMIYDVDSDKALVTPGKLDDDTYYDYVDGYLGDKGTALKHLNWLIESGQYDIDRTLAKKIAEAIDPDRGGLKIEQIVEDLNSVVDTYITMVTKRDFNKLYDEFIAAYEAAETVDDQKAVIDNAKQLDALVTAIENSKIDVYDRTGAKIEISMYRDAVREVIGVDDRYFKNNKVDNYLNFKNVSLLVDAAKNFVEATDVATAKIAEDRIQGISSTSYDNIEEEYWNAADARTAYDLQMSKMGSVALAEEALKGFVIERVEHTGLKDEVRLVTLYDLVKNAEAELDNSYAYMQRAAEIVTANVRAAVDDIAGIAYIDAMKTSNTDTIDLNTRLGIDPTSDASVKAVYQYYAKAKYVIAQYNLLMSSHNNLERFLGWGTYENELIDAIRDASGEVDQKDDLGRILKDGNGNIVKHYMAVHNYKYADNGDIDLEVNPYYPYAHAYYTQSADGDTQTTYTYASNDAINYPAIIKAAEMMMNYYESETEKLMKKIYEENIDTLNDFIATTSFRDIAFDNYTSNYNAMSRIRDQLARLNKIYNYYHSTSLTTGYVPETEVTVDTRTAVTSIATERFNIDGIRVGLDNKSVNNEWYTSKYYSFNNRFKYYQDLKKAIDNLNKADDKLKESIQNLLNEVAPGTTLNQYAEGQDGTRQLVENVEDFIINTLPDPTKAVEALLGLVDVEIENHKKAVDAYNNTYVSLPNMQRDKDGVPSQDKDANGKVKMIHTVTDYTNGNNLADDPTSQVNNGHPDYYYDLDPMKYERYYFTKRDSDTWQLRLRPVIETALDARAGYDAASIVDLMLQIPDGTITEENYHDWDDTIIPAHEAYEIARGATQDLINGTTTMPQWADINGVETFIKGSAPLSAPVDKTVNGETKTLKNYKDVYDYYCAMWERYSQVNEDVAANVENMRNKAAAEAAEIVNALDELYTKVTDEETIYETVGDVEVDEEKIAAIIKRIDDDINDVNGEFTYLNRNYFKDPKGGFVMEDNESKIWAIQSILDDWNKCIPVIYLAKEYLDAINIVDKVDDKNVKIGYKVVIGDEDAAELMFNIIGAYNAIRDHGGTMYHRTPYEILTDRMDELETIYRLYVRAVNEFGQPAFDLPKALNYYNVDEYYGEVLALYAHYRSDLYADWLVRYLSGTPDELDDPAYLYWTTWLLEGRTPESAEMWDAIHRVIETFFMDEVEKVNKFFDILFVKREAGNYFFETDGNGDPVLDANGDPVGVPDYDAAKQFNADITDFITAYGDPASVPKLDADECYAEYLELLRIHPNAVSLLDPVVYAQYLNIAGERDRIELELFTEMVKNFNYGSYAQPWDNAYLDLTSTKQSEDNYQAAYDALVQYYEGLSSNAKDEIADPVKDYERAAATAYDLLMNYIPVWHKDFVDGYNDAAIASSYAAIANNYRDKITEANYEEALKAYKDAIDTAKVLDKYETHNMNYYGDYYESNMYLSNGTIIEASAIEPIWFEIYPNFESGKVVLYSAYKDLWESDITEAVTNRVKSAIEAQLEKTKAVMDVEDLIYAIGNVTAQSGPAIARARNAYEQMNADYQEAVKNYTMLTSAEEKYNSLPEVIAAKADAGRAIDAIKAIGEVTRDSGDAIEAARAEYEALSDLAKSFVSNADVLDQAEQDYAKLDKASGDVDGKAGVTGDDVNMVLQFILGSIDLTDAQKTAADVNLDGKVNVLDLVVMIDAWINGKIKN